MEKKTNTNTAEPVQTAFVRLDDDANRAIELFAAEESARTGRHVSKTRAVNNLIRRGLSLPASPRSRTTKSQ